MKKIWSVVPEANTDNDTPTMWAAEINHEKHGKFVWITATVDDNDKILSCDVEVNHGGEIITLVTCKTLTSAKRWVSTHL